MTVIFSDDFESGGFGNWTGTGTGGAGSTVTAIAGAAHAGSYGARTYKPTGGNNGYAQAYKSITFPSSNKLSLLAWMKLVAYPSGGTLRLINMHQEGNVYNRIVSLEYVADNSAGSRLNLVLRNKDGSTQSAAVNESLLNDGTWHKVELFYDVTGSNPIAKLYIDDTQRGSTLTDTSTGTLYNPNRVVIEARETFWSATGDIYYDDVSVADLLQASSDINISGAGAISSPAGVGSPTLTMGAISISPSGIASLAGIGSPTVTITDPTIMPTGISSPAGIGSPTLTMGAISISPSGISSPAAIGSPSIAYQISAAGGVVSVAGVGSPTLSLGAATIAPIGISSPRAVGSPTITTSALQISPTGIVSERGVGVPTLTRPGVAPTSIRTVSANLAALQAAPNRTPTALAIIRKTRLEFEPWGVAMTPYHQAGLLYGDAPMFNGRSFMMADHVVFHDQIVSAISYNNSTYVRLVTDPTDISRWANWVLLSGAPGASGSRPALYAGESSVYLFLRSGTSIVRYWSDDGVTWTGPETIATSTFYGAAGNEVALAPVSPGQCYTLVGYPTGDDAGVRVCQWWPKRPDASSGRLADSWEIIAPYHNRTLTMCDAVRTPDGTDVVAYPGSAGDLTMLVACRNGQWSQPLPLFPANLVDDWNHVKLYSMDYIGSTLWLTGRITRYGSTSERPVAWDFMSRSYSDGEHWSVDPNSFVTLDEMRGKLLLIGDWVYYAGLYSIYRAKATWLIDESYNRPGTYHYVRPDDIVDMGIEIPQADGSPGALNLSTIGGRGALYWPVMSSAKWTWNDGHVWR